MANPHPRRGYAEEMMDHTENNILHLASQVMLIQTNQQPLGILQLLQQ